MDRLHAGRAHFAAFGTNLHSLFLGEDTPEAEAGAMQLAESIQAFVKSQPKAPRQRRR